jgi:hypothetical protein
MKKSIRFAINAVKRHSPPSVTRGLDLAEFFAIQRLIGFKVPSSPVFDAEGTAYFNTAIDRCHYYLEYGGGGSTVVASRLGKPFLSVDSDPYFVKALAMRVSAQDRTRLLYVDIGTTGLWGAPLRRARTTAQQERWRQYARAPWQRLLASGERPDLILLDGRFRPACALVCLKHLGHAPDTTLLFDDYAERPHYRIVERFARLEAMHGRMARFSTQRNDPVELDRALAEVDLDWR